MTVSDQFIHPGEAAPIPVDCKASITVDEDFVLVSIRRSCLDGELAAALTVAMLQAVEQDEKEGEQ